MTNMPKTKRVPIQKACELLGDLSRQRVHELCDDGTLDNEYETVGRQRLRMVAIKSITKYNKTSRRAGRPPKTTTRAAAPRQSAS